MNSKHTLLPFIILLVNIFIIVTFGQVQEESTHCQSLTSISMQLIINYINWRKIEHAIIFDSNLNKGNMPINTLQFYDCLGKQSIYTSFYSSQIKITKDIFQVNRHRLGVIVLLNYNETIDSEHVLMKASTKNYFTEQHAWLLVTCGPRNDTILTNLLRTLNITLISDIVIIFPLKNDNEIKQEIYNTSCPFELTKQEFIGDPNIKFIPHQSSKSLTTDFSSKFNNRFEGSQIIDVKDDSLLPIDGVTSNTWKNNLYLYYELIQMYKIRKEDEQSAVFTNLGSWGPKTRFKTITQFIEADYRQNLKGFPLIVDIKNSSRTDESTRFKNDQNHGFDVDVNDTEHLLEIMKFVAKSLNATIKYVPFESLGQEIQEGVWSDLLSGVVKEEVDLGLEKVTVSYHKLNYMAFTHNILKTSFNIYMHPSEFSVSKDIYLTPFSRHLLLSVLGMAILLALIMFIVSVVANYRARLTKLKTEDVNVSYAALWIVGILSMQGSIWSPISTSGNMILISSLIFALIIYNSYAAFITSILSVKTSDIKTLDDLYDNGYRVGYIQDSQDETYLQKQTSELKNIYLRGFDSKVSTLNEGLLLAANSKYALFVSTQAARRALEVLSPYECRCQIQEFALKSTIDDVAFPLSKTSPYHKVINIGIIRMIETGTLSRIALLMMPDMPTCSSDSSFISAQLEDVFTAVKLLMIGGGLSVVVAIIEWMVKHKKLIANNFKNGFFKMGNKIKDTVENFEF